VAALWPAGAQSACAFTFDLDAETIWLSRGVREPVALSQGRFGPVEALPRILELLRSRAMRTTFFIPGWVADHYPDAVQAILKDGHEIGCHGYWHEQVSEVGAREEEAILKKSLKTLERHTGTRPRGYRAPTWQFSPRTLRLLARHGFEYSSNFMDRLVPYVHPPVAGRSLVEIPVSWVLDDAPFFLFTGTRSLQPPGPVLEGWVAEFKGIHEAGGVTNFTFHPQIIGRPSRLACLAELVETVLKTPGVWVTALDAIAEHWRAAAR